MGNWVIHIEGHGVHDNKGTPGDADVIMKDTVLRLRQAGHEVHAASFTSGATKELPVSLSGSVEPLAEYKGRR
jgi:hypothetical protein